MDLAKQVSQRLDCDVVEANMGCYLLGSTSPDIRIITRRTREEYHFTTLDFEDVGAGVQGLFEAHPELRIANGHSGPTQAFIAEKLTASPTEQAVTRQQELLVTKDLNARSFHVVGGSDKYPRIHFRKVERARRHERFAHVGFRCALSGAVAKQSIVDQGSSTRITLPSEHD